MTLPTVTLPDGTVLPAIGQGTWNMGDDARRARAEEDALRLGLDLGLRVIDTAEMYGEGRSEELVGRAIAGRRDEAFLVSKVYPHNAGRNGVPAACARSLRRLGVEQIDLYLLHWLGSVPLAETVEAFERLRESGKIARWGVSNLDTAEMEEIVALPAGATCTTDQVLYNPQHRGIEFDLLPWAAARPMPLMAYSPLGQGGTLLRHAALRSVADRHGMAPGQVALAWAIRSGGVLAIPKASSAEHVRANAAAAALALSAADLAEIDRAFPPPRRKQPLGMI